MHCYPLKVLSYHRFGEEPEAYQYSRTYRQFGGDLRSVFDWLVFDDGLASQVEAAAMARERNVRVKLAVATDLLDSSDQYLTSDQVAELSNFHDIECHGASHCALADLSYTEVLADLERSVARITELTGRRPRYLIPPFNKESPPVHLAADKLELQVMSQRITIYKDTLL